MPIVEQWSVSDLIFQFYLYCGSSIVTYHFSLFIYSNAIDAIQFKEEKKKSTSWLLHF